MINQITYVTKKLQHHSINESPDNYTKITPDDRDSGTESDDETTFDETEIITSHEMSSDVSSGCSVRSRPTSQTSTDTLTCDDIPSGACDMLPPTITRSRGARTPRAAHSYYLRTPEVSRASSAVASDSPIESLLDSAIMSDCDNCDPVEHHSSEEELEPLTGAAWLTGPPEKRKWSQVARPSLTDSGSSDDEVCVLTTATQTPVKFHTSPPLEAHKPLRSASPPCKMSHFACNGRAEAFTIRNDSTRAASPRKRHRHTPRPHRPSLDFEKMQQMKNRAVTQWRNGGELSLSFF